MQHSVCTDNAVLMELYWCQITSNQYVMMNNTSPTRDLYILRLVDRTPPTDDVVRGCGDVVITRVLYLWIVDHLHVLSDDDDDFLESSNFSLRILLPVRMHPVCFK